MNKQTHTKFNLNNFLMALSDSLDNTVDTNKYNTKYSSKIFAYISLSIASKLKLSDDIMSDIFSYSIIYNNSLLNNNIEYIPFNTNNINQNTTIENIFKLVQIIINNINLQDNIIINTNEILTIINDSTNLDEEIKNIFIDLSSNDAFWFTLQSKEQLVYLIFNFLNDFTQEIDFNVLMSFTGTIHDMVYEYTSRDYSNSCIDEKAAFICDYFNFEDKDKARFIIAVHLHNIGLLNIPMNILNSSEKLNHSLYQIVKSAPFHTNTILGQIHGFSDIQSLSSSYCEKTDSSGYPFSLSGSDLSLKHRLLAILCTYQSLKENRSYRDAFSHEKACEILENENYDKELISLLNNFN